MARNINRDQKLRKERTNDILKHTVELFAQKGLEAMKISDIAKKAAPEYLWVHHAMLSVPIRDILLRELSLFQQGSYTYQRKFTGRPD